jgi:hypothetical protein
VLQVTKRSASQIPAQILPRYHDQDVTVNVEPNAFEDATSRVSPYAKLANAASNADSQKTLDGVQSGWWGDDSYRTFVVTESAPLRNPDRRPHSLWHSTGTTTHMLKVAPLCWR